MRRAIGSLVLGTVLTLAVLAFVSTTMAAEPNVKSGRADRPPVPGWTLGRRIPPISGPNQPSRTKPIRFEGTIKQLPTDTLTGTWTIIDENDRTRSLEVTQQTKIVPSRIEPQEGDKVHVVAKQEVSTLVARQILIKKSERHRVRPIHIHGEITDLPTPTGTITGTWVVNGVSLTVDSETKIRPKERTPEVGMWANVIAFQVDHALVADKIALQLREEADAEVEFEGLIEDLPEDGLLGTWVVRGINVRVTETTRLRGVTPTVGLNAEVEGQHQDDGSVLASKIKVEGRETARVEFEGAVVVTDAIPGVWTIRTDTEDITVTITLSTCINEREGRLEMDAWVEVKALEQPDGKLEAIYIKVEGGPDQKEEIEFEGTIEALPPSAPHSYKGLWTVTTITDEVPITVIVTGQTEVDSEPELGATAAVKGYLQGNGAIRAQSVRVDSVE